MAIGVNRRYLAYARDSDRGHSPLPAAGDSGLYNDYAPT
jgi:hypothetical protein